MSAETILAQSVSPEVLDRWFARAPVGARVVYASGQASPSGQPGFVRAGELARDGLAHLAQQRDPVRAGVTNYIIVKGARPARSEGAEAAGHSPVTRLHLTALEAVLRDGAGPGEARDCPSHARLAAAIGLRDPRGRGRNRVRYLLRLLARAGVIAITPGARDKPARVTVSAP